LNYLSPKIKEMILNGKLPKHLKFQGLMNGIPVLWRKQGGAVFELKMT
jgi:hypothetical protein